MFAWQRERMCQNRINHSRLFIKKKLQLSHDLNLEKQESKLIYKPRFNQAKSNSYLF